jgi:hypothetical protein
MSGNTVLRGKNYGAAQILAAVGSELTPCTKSLAVAGIDQGTIKLEDVQRHVPLANKKMIAAWRKEPAVQERLIRQNVVPLVKRVQAAPQHGATYVYRGKAFTAAEVSTLLKGERMTSANKAIVLLAIDNNVISEELLLRENRWLSTFILKGWRDDHEVKNAMAEKPVAATLHDIEADRLFRPSKRA